jgi:hydrogenase maturation protease
MPTERSFTRKEDKNSCRSQVAGRRPNNPCDLQPETCDLQPEMTTRIIGLGNSILTDDGVGIYAARELGRRLAKDHASVHVDIVETEVGGFTLMELMAGWKKVILLDAIQFDGLQPGTVVRIDPEDLHTSLRIRSVHDIDLPTALELGRRMGFDMPEKLTVFGIQAQDMLTFGELLTEPATHGMNKAVDLVLKEIRDSKFEIRNSA